MEAIKRYLDKEMTRHKNVLMACVIANLIAVKLITTVFSFLMKTKSSTYV